MFGILKRNLCIPVIHMSGVIGEESDHRKDQISYRRFQQPLRNAFNAADRKGCVAIIVNSPGGTPGQSELIGTEILRLSEKYKIPAFAFVEDMAASGGYWIASSCGKIYALSTSVVGSIGVIGGMLNYHDLLKSVGVKYIQLQAGADKSLISPYTKHDESDAQKLIGHMHEPVHELFKNWVRDQRGDRLDKDREEIFSGRIWVAKNALDEHTGLVDGIGAIDIVLSEKFGAYTLKDFTPKTRKIGRLRSLLGFESGEAREERLVRAAIAETLTQLGVPKSPFDMR